AALLTAWRILRCNPTGGYGVDEPCWPPPAYWAGSKRVRTYVDDEISKARAEQEEREEGGSDDESTVPPNLPRL
ncbi:MAG: hypothetical protein SGPRY_010595, partial [Prymnesium sp.]